MCFVDSFNVTAPRLRRTQKMHGDFDRPDSLAWHCMIHEHHRERSIFAKGPRTHCVVLAFNVQLLVTQTVKQFKFPVNRLGDIVQIQQAEAAVKRQRWKIVLIKDVAERPKAVRLRKSSILQNYFRRVRSGERFVVQRIAAIALGMKLSSTNGRTLIERRKSNI